MKTLLKMVGVLVALVVVVAGGGLGYLMLAFPKVPPPAVVTLEPTPERLARGKYLSDHTCGTSPSKYLNSHLRLCQQVPQPDSK